MTLAFDEEDIEYWKARLFTLRSVVQNLQIYLSEAQMSLVKKNREIKEAVDRGDRWEVAWIRLFRAQGEKLRVDL